MKVYLNNREFELENNSTLQCLLEQSGIINPSIMKLGIAAAVNNYVIPKAQWNAYFLNDNDKITIINAVCGG